MRRSAWFSWCFIVAVSNGCGSTYVRPVETEADGEDVGRDLGIGVLTDVREDAANDAAVFDLAFDAGADAGVEVAADLGMPDVFSPDAWSPSPVVTSCSVPVTPYTIAPGLESFFSASTLPLIELTVTEEAWENYCANGVAMSQTADDPDFAPLWAQARVVIAGEEVLAPVGIRPWGRSSLEMLFAGNDAYEHCVAREFSYKPSVKISFHAFAPGTRFRGMKKLSLGGHQGSQTLAREYLFSRLGEELGLPVQRVGHAALCVNGQYWGVYTSQQEYDDRPFLRDHLADPDGTFYKVTPGESLTYPIDAAEEYGRRFVVRAGADPGLTELRAFLRFVNLTESGEFAAALPSWLDVSNWLRTTALETTLLDADGAYTRGNNYLLYRDTRGRWSIIRHDADLILNESPTSWDDDSGGSRLLCYQWSRDGSLNLADGRAPMRDDEFTVWSVRRPVPQARMLYATHRDMYLDEVERVLGTVEASSDTIFSDLLARVGPWIGDEDVTHDPFEDGVVAWTERVGRFRTRLEDQLRLVDDEFYRLRETGSDETCPR